MEVLPEPLLMWGLMSKTDGDFLGNLAGLWNGNLGYAQPLGTGNEDKANYETKTYPASLPRKYTTPEYFKSNNNDNL